MQSSPIGWITPFNLPHTIPYREGCLPYRRRLLGGMLKAALDYDTLVTSDLSPQEAIAAMDTRHENYDPIVLSALAEIHLQYVGN